VPGRGRGLVRLLVLPPLLLVVRRQDDVGRHGWAGG
jgi:hypothetical protein